MSKHQQQTGEGQMPLPSPRSPKALDEKILAHARAHTPPKRSSIHMGWTGGLATAAVLVMAVYLTTTTETIKEPVLSSPQAVKEERAATAAATTVSSEAAAKRKATAQADFDSADELVSEQEELQMAPVAEMAAGAATLRSSKTLDWAAPNIQETLDQLQALLEGGELESASQGYAELRSACGECGLPDTLEQALEDRRR